ncbi:olfactory receptor 6S1-like [Lepus europaeus]|uniref:olfactory receptor 6S1-like n=1 Tax=Lepus europaeus TaxID=9983 RepID=UPI002B46FA22|nr:olfactory receptor 6S1-like [Lepus europaeus]
MEFILLGFQTERATGILLLCTFLLMYVTLLIGNTMIILLECGDHCLHSPMYFFVANLSFLEVTITSTVVLKMLATSLSPSRAISFMECLTQSFFYFLLGSTEFFILAVMPLDRYVAICNPLSGGSYSCIITTIVRAPSVQGRWKASTCISHITVVTLYYGSSIFIYVHPRKGDGMDVNKFATVLNTIVTPMLNPFIYSF